MTDFSFATLPQLLGERLQTLGFKTPTPIQKLAIPVALEGRDILGSADTGTGKTAAFGIPLISRLLEDESFSGLVITPTRELATQVLKSLSSLIDRKAKIDCALLIGGENIDRQIKSLKRFPRLVVGTPGRINDHLKRGSLNLSQIGYVVLDETDRMLDMGFVDQIHTILRETPSHRQTLLFSATLPNSILKLAESFMRNPQRLAVESTLDTSKLQHEVIRLSGDDKRTRLTELLRDRLGSVILFVKTKYGTEKMAKFLQNAGFSSDALHGDLKHSRRERVTQNFRNQKFQVLVATDVAARGLDIPHIEHVINFDLPQCPEDYIHRIGRTARAGRSGEALSFVTPSDRRSWGVICKLMNLDDAGFGYEHDTKSENRKQRNRKQVTIRKGSKKQASTETRPAEMRPLDNGKNTSKRTKKSTPKSASSRDFKRKANPASKKTIAPLKSKRFTGKKGFRKAA